MRFKYIFLFNFIERPGNKRSSSILLYSFVISDGFQLSIFSALSEDQSANFLTFWIAEFVKMFNHIPNIFVCDMSFALINAAVRSFAQCPSIAEYLDVLYHLINRAKNPIKISRSHMRLIKTPLCLIKIDIAHLMNLLNKNKALNAPTIWKKSKDFYMRCVAILVQTKSLEHAEALIYSTLIVALSKTEGECFYMKFLQNII